MPPPPPARTKIPSSPHTLNTPSPSSYDSSESSHLVGVGETPAWTPCGRISSTERANFYEFIACNLLFALAAIAIVYVRSRRRSLVQARQLAARIGLVRNRLGNGNGNGNAGEG